MLIKSLSLLFLGIGIFVLMQVVSPFLAFKSWEIFAFDQQSLLADPNPQSKLVSPSYSGITIEDIGNFPAFIVRETNFSEAPYSDFNLSIPSLDINSLKVIVNTNEFDKNLAHLPDTALPGERGNVFITGHSSLENVSLNNKFAFFANLPKIKKGDTVVLTALGQQFKYVVRGLKIVEPKDVSVINPPDSNGRYLTLMTCVPPGFNTKRLIVLAELKS